MRGRFLSLITAAVLVLGCFVAAGADITDPLLPTSQSFLPTDQIQGIVRGGHQNLAGQMWQLNKISYQAGSCAMVSATTCTITVSNAYTQAAAICFAQDQSGFIASHASLPQNSTTLTVTAASSQSDTFVADCEGNPY